MLKKRLALLYKEEYNLKEKLLGGETMERIKKGIAFFLLAFVLAFATPVTMTNSLAATTYVKVTLEILWNSASTKVDNSTYYVTAYSDSACTNAVSTKSIRIENDSTGSVIFNNLSTGTYYIAESNSSGTLKTDTNNLTISYPNGNTATVSTTTSSSTDMVWIPKTGEKYHSSSTCSNMKDPTQVSVATAEQRGYEPCSKCYTGGTSTMATIRIQNNYSVDPNYASAKTADESQPLLYGGLAILCVAVGSIVISRRKYI